MSSPPCIPVPPHKRSEERAEDIRRKRKRLDMEIQAARTRTKFLLEQQTKLRESCEHPNDIRSRDYSMYGGTEYYCPDCGREKYI
jgi:hypothetical protein